MPHEDRSFEEIRSAELTKFAEDSINALFRNHPTIYVEISSRTKTAASIKEKINRKKYITRDQITDASGVRIICLSQQLISEIIKILQAEFETVEVVDAEKTLGSDRMGYRDTKLVMKLGAKYQDTSLSRHIAAMLFEVQIRTVFQDAWAKLAHVLLYKKEADIPDTLKRRINLLSSICEGLDDITERIYTERQNLTSATQSSMIVHSEDGSDKFAHIPLNFDTLVAYSNSKFQGKPVNPGLQSKLLQDIDRSRYEFIGDIDRIIDDAKPFLDWYEKIAPELFKYGTDYLTKALGFIDQSFRQNHGFGTQTLNAFREFGPK